MKHHYLRLLLSLIAVGTMAQAPAQITLHEATNVTQTKATLSADFPDLSVEHGFQYKYGTLPEIDDFSRTALAPQSDPVQISTTGTYAWSARTAKGWVESNTSVPVGQASSMSAEITITEETPISFEWAVDSEDNIGIFSFIVDGETIGSITGLVDFEKFTYTLPEGTHKLEWQYKKSTSTSIGLDLAKLKDIIIANTTPGEWISATTTSSEFELSAIYPQKSYLFRAFSKSSETNVYNFSQIGSFATKNVSIGEIALNQVSQTTADISLTPDTGDANVKIVYNLYNNETYENAQFFKYLLDDDTFGGKISTPSDLTKWSINTNEEWNCVSASSYLELTFTLDAPTTISFEWANRSYNGKCTPSLTIDGVKKDYNISVSNIKPSDFRSYKINLSEGEHTLIWYYGYYRPSLNNVYYGTNYLRNLSIPGLSRSLIHEKEVSYNGNQPIQFSENGLKPNTKYYVQGYMLPDFTSNLPYEWDTHNSELLSFITLPVYAKTCTTSDITQSSATIKGEVDGGDAQIEAIGIQFKEESSTSWIDNQVASDQLTFSQKISRLRPNTKYICRSYIKPIDSEIVFSQEDSFVTKSVEPCKPTILSLCQHEATLQGKVIFGDANIYQRGMQFRKKGITEWEEVEDGGNDSIYTLVRKNLEMGVAYEARTYVQPAGCDVIYSDILEFTTLYSYFTACNANNTTQTTATFEATISDVDEDTTVDEYGFEYYIYGDGFLEDQNNFVPSEIYTIPIIPDGQTIKTTITGLAPRLFLRWRAYAIVNGEKSYYAGSANSEWAYAATKSATIKATATKITPTSLSLELDATQDGDAVISQIEYALVNSPMDAAEYSICGNNITLTGLLPNSKYNFMFRGLVNGRFCPLFDSVYQDFSWFTFTTPAADVDVKIINVTQTKAEMNIIIDAGEEAEVTDLRYRLSNYGNWTECSEKLSLSGLTPGQKYNVSIRAKINGIEYTWSEYEFTTRIVSATVYTSDIQQTSARIRWSTFQGDATLISSGVEIGSDKYDFTDDTRTVTITGLLPNTSYSVRSYVQTVEGGKIYSQYRTIKTSEIICTTTSATSISNRSATLNGTIDCDTRSSAEFGVQWKKMIGWNSDPAFTKGHKLDDGSISVALVNGMLDPDTDYQYRTAVRYKDKIYYGDWATFRTEAEYVYYPASVYTIFRTDRENNSLVLCGYYIAGSEAIVSQGYEYWKKNPNAIHPLAAQSPAIVTTDESMQHAFAPGELPAGDYNVRAFVKTESGETIYGPTLGFTASNAGYSEVEEIPCDMPSVKVEHSIVKIYNAAGLECYVARINGIVVSSHTIPGDYDEIALSPGYYIIKLSNGLVEKIRL